LQYGIVVVHVPQIGIASIAQSVPSYRSDGCGFTRV